MQVLTLTGNVGRDPELRSTQGGDQVCSFTVASKQGFKRDAPTEWFRVSVWGKRGETIANHLKKGAKVTVVGEFTIGEYQGKPQYEIRANDVDFAPASNGQREERQERNDNRGGGGGGYSQGFGDDLDSDVPF